MATIDTTTDALPTESEPTSLMDSIHWSIRYGATLAFLIAVFAAVRILSPVENGGFLLIFAAVVAGYMAINIGANDTANNIGPAVGSKAISLGAAIVLAAICEAAGALVAGGDVVGTIKSGIIDPALIEDSTTFVWLMTGALMAAAIWLNFATLMGAPVSTTHSIVGSVLGAGLAAGGMGIADWSQLGAIVASWVISPAMGGLIAAGLLLFIKHTIMYRDDVSASARTTVPWLVALMAWAFTSYLMLKGVSQIWKVSAPVAFVTGLVVGAGILVFTKRWINRREDPSSNVRDNVNSLFTVPLIFAAGLLIFAHGANDVSNAIGPLAAIAEAFRSGEIATQAAIPLWIMGIGALGLAIGLALFGPRLIRTVGGEITELDKSRAFCIAMAAALTVIIASQLGLPVSSTHVALGGLFGVGFLREYLKSNNAAQLHLILKNHNKEDQEKLTAFLQDFPRGPADEMKAILKQAKKNPDLPFKKGERKRLKKMYRKELVKRHHLYRIVAAWVITVPASAILGAMMFFMLRGMLL